MKSFFFDQEVKSLFSPFRKKNSENPKFSQTVSFLLKESKRRVFFWCLLQYCVQTSNTHHHPCHTTIPPFFFFFTHKQSLYLCCVDNLRISKGVSFMEDQNQNQNQNSTSVTQNEPKTTTKEELAVVVKANNDNNNAATDAVGVDAGSDTGARSEAAGSGQVVVKRGRGRPRKYEVGGNQLSPASAPPPGFAIQPFGGGDVKRGRGRPRGSGKLQILASIGECFFHAHWFFINLPLHDIFLFCLGAFF